jgi:hypothetical protein
MPDHHRTRGEPGDKHPRPVDPEPRGQIRRQRVEIGQFVHPRARIDAGDAGQVPFRPRRLHGHEGHA